MRALWMFSLESISTYINTWKKSIKKIELESRETEQETVGTNNNNKKLKPKIPPEHKEILQSKVGKPLKLTICFVNVKLF